MNKEDFLNKEIDITRKLINELILDNITEINEFINIDDLTDKIFKSCSEKMSLNKLYNYTADFCAVLVGHHPEYDRIASNILIKWLYNVTPDKYSDAVHLLYNNTRNNVEQPIISKKLYDYVMTNKDIIDEKIKLKRDKKFDYFGIRTLMKSYLLNIYIDDKKNIIERPQYLFMRVSLAIHHDDLDKAFETYDYLTKKYFVHATPTLFNAGTNREQLSSCFLFTMDDNIEDIFEKIKAIALTSKFAGGIGLSIAAIRAKGSLIKGTNGISGGIIPLMRTLNEVAKYINQGGKRKGSIVVYIEPWHADIYDFCDIRSNRGKEEDKARDLFIGLWIPDLFMERVKNEEMWSLMCPDECPNLHLVHGKEFEELYLKYEKEKKYKRQVPAIDLFFHIMESQIETGMPYMLYKDSANKKSNQQNLGTIRLSNLCVDADTYILTDKGQIMIKELENKNIKVWNGEEWSETIVRKTGTNKDLLRVSFSNGSFIDCTPEHKFYIQQNLNSKKFIEVRANELTNGMCIIKYKLPNAFNIESNEEFNYPYTHGFFCGDGTTYPNYSKTKMYPKLYLYGEKKNLLEHIENTSSSINDSVDRIDVILPKDLRTKFDVPFNFDINTRLRWFEGYCDADGTIAKNENTKKNGTNVSLQIASINNEFLNKIRMMLQTLGIESKVRSSQGERKKLLPDGKGGKKLFDCKPIWRLLISSNELYKLSLLGFKPKRLIFEQKKPLINTLRYIKIESVQESKKNVDTFCFTENKKHMGIFNGILCGQCAEILEYSDKDEISVCNLASLCLPSYIKNNKFDFDKLEKATQIVTENLNKIIDINYYTVKETKRSNLRHRPMAIGVQGFSDVFNILGLPFESLEASILNKKMFECIYYASLKKSIELAKRDGPYETFAGSPFSKGELQWHLWGLKESDLLMGYDWESLIKDLKQYGTRNSLLTTAMPTATTSQIMGFSEGIDLKHTNIFERSTLSGEFTVVNKNLIKDLLKLGIWNDKLRKKILVNQGSLQNIFEVPLKLKKIYKTAFEIKQYNVIKQSAERGPFIDQSQSLNIFIEKPDMVKLMSAHFDGWEMGLKTGLYYLRSDAANNPINFGIDPEELKEIMNELNTNKKPDIKKIFDNESKGNLKKYKKIEACESCT